MSGERSRRDVDDDVELMLTRTMVVSRDGSGWVLNQVVLEWIRSCDSLGRGMTMLPELDDERSPRRSGGESEYSFSTATTPRSQIGVSGWHAACGMRHAVRHAVRHVYDEYML